MAALLVRQEMLQEKLSSLDLSALSAPALGQGYNSCAGPGPPYALKAFLLKRPYQRWTAITEDRERLALRFAALEKHWYHMCAVILQRLPTQMAETRGTAA